MYLGQSQVAGISSRVADGSAAFATATTYRSSSTTAAASASVSTTTSSKSGSSATTTSSSTPTVVRTNDSVRAVPRTFGIGLFLAAVIATIAATLLW